MSKNGNVHPSNTIAPSASVDESIILGRNITIGGQVHIAGPGDIGNGVRIGKYTRIGTEPTIEDNVFIGRGVVIGYGVLILSGARVCPNSVRSVSTNGRELGCNVTVGPDVLLHDEVELGENAIVPTQRTIAHIGNLGSKNRVVTIYGSDYGPRYSIGCQMGKSLGDISDRVMESTATSEDSAGTYMPYLGVFDEIGSIVQSAYDAESSLVDELKAIREENPYT